MVKLHAAENLSEDLDSETEKRTRHTRKKKLPDTEDSDDGGSPVKKSATLIPKYPGPRKPAVLPQSAKFSMKDAGKIVN